MEAHYKLTDPEFEQQFQAGTLDPSIFSHEAHVRLAWIHIKSYGLDIAVGNIRKQLQQFVKHIGAKGKYNDTLTVTAIMAVNHFIKRSSTNNFNDFINEYPRLKTNFKDLVKTHYSQDIFNSEEYKQNYIAPDLLAFT